MLYILLILIQLLFFNIANANHTPAEFEEQEAVWLAWSFDEAKRGYPYSEVQMAIINALRGSQKIKILVKNQKELEKVRLILNNPDFNQDSISYFVVPTDTIWLRDTGPTFFKNQKNRLGLIQFAFNQWGYDPDCIEDSLDSKIVYSLAKRIKLPCIKSPIISEGGNREINGLGTLIVVEEVELSRNPLLTKKQLEENFSKTLGIKKVIWLKQGLCEDRNPSVGLLPDKDGKKNLYTPLTPGGHIDAFCRFVAPNKILLAQVTSADLNNPIAQENFKRLEENFEILKTATDQDGNLFEIIRMPIADPLYDTFNRGDPFHSYISQLRFLPTKAFPEGRFLQQDTYPVFLTTSYLNFLITNTSVLTARYWKEGMPLSIKEKDQEVAEILKEIFPDKKIVGIDVYNVNLAGGGIHCMTAYEPKN